MLYLKEISSFILRNVPRKISGKWKNKGRIMTNDNNIHSVSISLFRLLRKVFRKAAIYHGNWRNFHGAI